MSFVTIQHPNFALQYNLSDESAKLSQHLSK
ncbi:MAG: hypothetical protein RIQ74_112 [Pseudomonadota bacterium]|jgi:hypothetical protein